MSEAVLICSSPDVSLTLYYVDLQQFADSSGYAGRKPTIYLFPDDENENTWIEILQLARCIRDGKDILGRAYVIRDLRSSNLDQELSKFDQPSITTEEKHLDFYESEKNNFTKNLKELAKHAEEQSQSKKWRVNSNGHSFFVLIVNSGIASIPNYLRRLLAKYIEEECIKNILTTCGLSPNKIEQSKQHFQVHRRNKVLHNMQDETAANEPEAKRKKTYGNCIFENKNQFLHPSQECVAKEIYKIIIEKLLKTKQIDCENELLSSFHDFEFLILLPNRTTLEKQTRDRLYQARHFYSSGFTPTDTDNVIRIETNSGRPKQIWNDFMKKARSNAKTLYLIIHDECHWAAGKKQSSYKLLGFEEGDYHVNNCCLLPNLFTLMVSATPFNFFTSKDLTSKDILNWNTFLKTSNLENQYQGLSKLREHGKIQSSPFDSNLEKQIGKQFESEINNGFSVDFLQVMIDYVLALADYKAREKLNGNHQSDSIENFEQQCRFAPSDGAKQSVFKCFKDRKLIVVRLNSAKDDVQQSAVAKEVFVRARDQLKLMFEVFVNSSKEARNDAAKFHKSHHEILRHNIQQRLGTNEKCSYDSLQFTDVEGIPMIMFIIEQGRMGDTFPSSCTSFDLRARYRNDVKDFTSVIQDVGRAFGYGERPTLLLSEKANTFLQKIWSSETNSISYEALKIELNNVLLGKQMKRLKVVPDNGNLDEAEEESDELELFRQFYEADEKKAIFLYNLGSEAFRHRFILKAEPQIGKTGAFLHLLYLFASKIRDADKHRNYTELQKFTGEYYSQHSLQRIAEEMHTEEGRKRHKRYITLLQYSRKKRKEEGLFEPSHWASLCLLDDIIKNQTCNAFQEIHIADFGCGDMQFANFFVQEMQKHACLSNIIFVLHAFDISPNEIPDLQLQIPRNVCIRRYPGTSCSFVNRFDYVISTLALFGNGESWKWTVKSAMEALKIGGLLILAEFKSRLSAEILHHLPNIGIECASFPVPGDFHARYKFCSHFVALSCRKLKEYQDDGLYTCLLNRPTNTVDQNQEFPG